MKMSLSKLFTRFVSSGNLSCRPKSAVYFVSNGDSGGDGWV
jgi:hypothetical protein